MLARPVTRFSEANQALANWMEENLPEGATVYDFARSTHRRLRTINGLGWREAVNRYSLIADRYSEGGKGGRLNSEW